MAQLTITAAGNTDFRGGPAETNIDQIIFATPGPGVATGIFAPAQFGAGLISNSVEITGDAFQNRIRVDFASPATFSAANWTFVNWGANDEVQLFGSTGSDNITGSSRRDNIATSNGLTNGVDHISAGAGNDKIQMTGNSFAAGTTVDGGTHDAGGFDEVTSNGLNDDLRAVVFSNVERLSLISNAGTATVNGDQIGTGGFTQLGADSGETVTLRVLDSDVDLRGVTTFVNWGTDDTIEIAGTSTLSNVLFGSAQNDTIHGTGNSSDLMTGGGGVDILTGGKGGDNFRYFAGSELVSGEVIDGGLGADALSLFGAGLVDFGLATMSGVETLDFVSGNSTARFKSSQVASAGDITNVSGSAGVDQLVIDVVDQFADLANLTFTQWTNGTDAITILGAALSDTLSGSGFNDTIDGSGGGDLMTGRAGSDAYGVDNASDVVDESVAGSNGIDTVSTSVTISLADAVHFKGDIENVILLGAANINATGNALANVLIGNSGANTLDGGTGADTMQGLAGNDLYGVRDLTDIVDESVAGSGGTDTVNAVVTVSLADAALFKGNIENVTLLGTANLNATGNALANVLTGNSGSNTLDGGTGADTMIGLAGNDIYGVRDITDIADESVAGSAGIDKINSLVNVSLVQVANAAIGKGSIENITLLGTGNIFAFGNGFANVLVGNAGNNTLAAGNGNDTLTGAQADDIFIFNTALGATNVDTITDMNEAGNDTIHLENAIFTGLAAGALAAGAFHIGVAAAAADDRIIYNNVNGQLSFDADGNGAGSGVVFATLDTSLALTAADFFVI